MSEAILAFQSQLSGVMETVFKAAMYEIIRLVEDSFLEEVSRSREQVETLKKRLQLSESKRKEREGDGRSRCAECGRAGAASDQMEDRLAGAAHGVTEGHGLKQEGAQESKWDGCPREDVDPAVKVLDETMPGPTMSSEETTSLGNRRDPALKNEVPRKAPCRGGTGSHGASDASCHGGWREQERTSTDRHETWPSSAAARLMEQPRGIQNMGQTSQLYATQTGQEDITMRISQEGVLCSAGASDDRDQMYKRVAQVRNSIEQGSGISEEGFLQAKPQSCGEGLSPLKAIKMHNEFVDCVLIKQEEPVSDVLHVREAQHIDDRAGTNILTVYTPQVPVTQHIPPLTGGCLGAEEPPMQAKKQLQGLLGRDLEVELSENTGESNVKVFPEEGTMSVMAENSEAHCKAHAASIHLEKNLAQVKQTGRSPYSCMQCGKSFSHTCHLKAHLQTHTGERPFICSLCGRSFTKLSNLKAHRRVHTGERPYICVDCGKRFTQKCNLKRHQRIHTERLFRCK